MIKSTVLATVALAAVLVTIPRRAHALDFMATERSCSQAPADQQSDCRACVNTQAMLRSGVAKHWWPSQPPGDRCVTALRSVELVRARGTGIPSSSPSTAGGPSASSSPSDDSRPNATIYTSSRCDRVLTGLAAAECRRCTENPRGNYHQYQAAGTRCRNSRGEILGAGEGSATPPAAPASGGAPAAGADPRNDPREYSTVYTVSRCERHIPGHLRAECTRCVDTPRGTPTRRFHQFEVTGTRCRSGNNVIVQP